MGHLSLVLLLVCGTPAAAEPSYGAVAGVNVVHFPDTPTTARTGLDLHPTVGGFFRFSSSFGSVDLGIQYSWRRVSWWSCRSESCGGEVEMAWSTHDLEFPVVARPRITASSRMRLDFLVGVAPSVVLHKAELSSRDVPGDLSSLASQDFVILAGLGAQYRVGDFWLGIDFRGSAGVVPRYDPGDSDARTRTRAAYFLFTVAREPVPRSAARR